MSCCWYNAASGVTAVAGIIVIVGVTPAIVASLLFLASHQFMALLLQAFVIFVLSLLLL